MKTTVLALTLLTATLAHADSIGYWVDALNPKGNIDYLVEIGPPPFVGYSSDTITWVEDSFVFDSVDVLFCDPFSTNCNVLDAYGPKDTQPWCPPGTPQPLPIAPKPSEVPEPGTWVMAGIGFVGMVIGRGRI